MGLYYDSNGTAHCIPPGGMVPTDAVGPVRESGVSGNAYFPGQQIQPNNYLPPSLQTAPVPPAAATSASASMPYVPHSFVGFETCAPHLPLPRDPGALLPPPYYRQKRSYPRLKKLVRVTALLCFLWLSFTLWTQPRESFTRHVQRTMRIPLHWFSSIAISLGLSRQLCEQSYTRHSESGARCCSAGS